MKRLFYIIIFALILSVSSCVSTPPVKEEKAEAVPETALQEEVKKETEVSSIKEEPKKEEAATIEVKEELQKDSQEEVVATFEGVSITKKEKDIAKSEIDIVVENLNAITAQKDYYRWLHYLSDEYKGFFSSKRELEKASVKLQSKVKGLTLKTLEDYFKYIFVPSRQEIKIHDIKYISPVRVEAYKIENGIPLTFYTLEKINDRWLLVPKN